MLELLQAELGVSSFCPNTSPNGADPQHLLKVLYNQLWISTNCRKVESKLLQMKQIAASFLQGRSCMRQYWS